MVFITCGEGGGTGTGASPLVAHVAKELGALTVAVVTRPFSFEGARRSEVAEKGIEKLKKEVDAIIVLSGNRFLEDSEEAKSRPLPSEAFKSEDDAVLEAVRGVVQPLQSPYVNVDFDTIKSVMGGAGAVFFGTGSASGKGRGSKAAKKALNSDFVEEKIGGAHKALVSISGSKDLGMSEVNSAMEAIKSAISPEAQIIMGLTLDDALGDDVKVTVYEG